MTIALLHKLAAEHLPQTLCDAQDIEAAHVLVLAGHVRATFFSSARGRDGRCVHPAATVHSLTSLGHRYMRAFPRTRKAEPDGSSKAKSLS